MNIGLNSRSYHIRSVDVGRGQYGALLLRQLGTRTLAGNTLPENSSAAAATTDSAFWAAAANAGTTKAATNSGATTQGAIPCLGKESFLFLRKDEIYISQYSKTHFKNVYDC